MDTPVVVIGAGTAGLAVSHHLSQRGVDHLVFERGRVGETWRSQRWDSFQVNTPNRFNGLPGSPFPGDPDRFATAAELVGFLSDFGSKLPVREGVTVTALRAGTGGLEVRTDRPEFDSVAARAVVVASGAQNRARVPAQAAMLPADLLQVTAAGYRNPAALPPGAVLVVGSAQSGCQIAEDLLAGGRRVYLGVSRVARARRRYRGQDMLAWFDETGFLDQRPADLADPAMMRSAQPQISGVGEHGHTVSLQGLASRGVVLVGRLVGCEGSRLQFDDSVAECVSFADAGSAFLRSIVDGHLASTGKPLPPVEPDPEDEPCPDPAALAGPVELDAATLGAVVWCTGFGGDFSWIHLPVLDTEGRPIHKEGRSPVPGLFFLGFPWLRFRRSGIIPGVGRDAGYVADAVVEHLGR